MVDIFSVIYPFSIKILPYITIVVFFVGMVLRCQRWLSAPPDKEGLKLDLAASLKYIFLDVVLFRKTFKRDKFTWIMLFLFHGSIAGIMFGHMRGFHLWSAAIFDPLGHWAAEFMVHTLPIYVGWVFLFTQIILLGRRVYLENKQLTSTSTDYIALILLIIVAIVGQGMRLYPPEAVPTEVYNVVFIPRFIVLHLETVPSYHWFHLHVIVTQLFVMYTPFSKFIHVLSGVITPAVYGSRRKEYGV